MSQQIYQQVTDRIIAELEHGAAPWVKPWNARVNGRAYQPHNMVSHRPYHGINTLILSMQQVAAGYQTGAWATFKQVNALGGFVRKGEKSTVVVYFKPHAIRERDKVTGEETTKTIPLLRTYLVFNLDQTTLPAVKDAGAKPAEFSAVPNADETIKQTGARIVHGGDAAFYSPSGDYIGMPDPAAFADPASYYATAFHELTHWTGHDSRLKRPIQNRFGNEAYAFEELVAELGAAFLCAEHDIAGELRHAGYIESWLKVLRQDNRAVFKAAALAQRAADFVTGAKTGELEQAA